MADPDKLYQDALNQINAVQTPDIDKMRVQLQQLVQQGVLTPQQAQAQLLSGNAYDSITTDPVAAQAQQQALAQLQEIGNDGGMTPMDKAQLANIENELNTTERGRQEAIMQNAQARGVGGSGLEMAQRMVSEQGAADRASQEGLDAAAQAQQRALAAIQQSGQLGTQLREQGYNEQAQKASAQNAIDAANVAMSNEFNMYNTQAANAAQAQNLAEKQRIADANAQTKNQQDVYNSGLYQQQFQDQLAKAQGSAGVLDQWGANAAKQQQQRRGFQNGITAGLLQTGANAVSKGMAGSFQPQQPGGTTEMAPAGYNPGGSYAQTVAGLGYSHGGMVPGVPKQPGDSPANDTVPARLSPGEMVVPRSEVARHPDLVATFLHDMPRAHKTVHPDDIASVLHALGSMRGGM